MKRGVVIYESWAPLLRRLPVALRGEVVLHVLDFSATGEQEFTGDPAADMLLAVMYETVAADMQKYEEKCAKNKANITKRYEKKNDDDDIRTNTTEYERIRPNTNATNININRNINKNITKEKNTLTCVKKEMADEAATRTPAQVRHDKFMAWLAENCPYIAQHYKLPSPELLEKLITRYGAEAVAEECGNIENRLDKRKNYTNLYQTLNNWLKRDYGDNKGNNAEGGREQRARSYAAVMQQLLDEDDRRAAEAAAHVQPVGAN